MTKYRGKEVISINSIKDEILTKIVKSHHSYGEIFEYIKEKYNINYSQKNFKQLKEFINRLNITTYHFSKIYRTFDIPNLEELITQSHSLDDIYSYFGLTYNSHYSTVFKKVIKNRNLEHLNFKSVYLKPTYPSKDELLLGYRLRNIGRESRCY